ncbi:hypothetical protein [Noviherbaspirillum saxi]|uniref:Uncharacterized protein n=1 Tax=Noviherbaspirillum saxi TaxID=2320863 RepID=A0A3A3FFU4_9BURK|nr:hypothetical protein [Noviherbaspirillum saxi]RJF92221.1 hypothetical protein D3871_26675 [Noviherbaspirillum saxi]
MISFSVSDLISVVGVVIAFTALLLTVMVIYNNRRHTRYDDDRHRIELELMRRSIESQMYGLNEKLLATEDRWRDVNHLLISSQSRQPDAFEPSKQVVPSVFLSSAGISPDDLKIERDLVFVLTPFHPTYKKQFEVVASVCNGLGLRAMRGDEEFVPGDVFPHILRLITRARIVVAIIDGRNPNVFYELGIAHALGKPAILIAPTPEDVPFDIRTKRLVLFQSLDELQEKLKDELARVVVASEQPIQPVAEARTGVPELLPEARVLLKEASLDPQGAIILARYIGGTTLQTNGKNLIPSNERREVARWEQALELLTARGLVVARGHKGEIYEVTNTGYQVADMIDL